MTDRWDSAEGVRRKKKKSKWDDESGWAGDGWF